MPNSTNETIFPLTIMMIVMVLMGAAGLYFFCQLETVSALFRIKRCQPIADAPVSVWLESPPASDAPAEAPWLPPNIYPPKKQ